MEADEDDDDESTRTVLRFSTMYINVDKSDPPQKTLHCLYKQVPQGAPVPSAPTCPTCTTQTRLKQIQKELEKLGYTSDAQYMKVGVYPHPAWITKKDLLLLKASIEEFLHYAEANMKQHVTMSESGHPPLLWEGLSNDEMVQMYRVKAEKYEEMCRLMNRIPVESIEDTLKYVRNLVDERNELMLKELGIRAGLEPESA